MTTTPSTSGSFATRTFRGVCLGALLVFGSVMGGASDAGMSANRAAVVSIEVASGVDGLIVLDPAAFGSSAGQANLRPAPATWSSRFNVRWNARWDSRGRYLV